MKLTVNKIMYFLTGLLMFLNVQPYFIWSWLSNSTINLGLVLTTLTLFWLNLKTFTFSSYKLLIVFIVTLITMGFLNGLNIAGLITTIGIASIPFAKTQFIKNTYIVFYNLFFGALILSLISFGLLLIGYSLPYLQLSPLNTLKAYNYIAYPFLVIPNTLEYISLSGINRFFGPFDEPGVIGTISLIILYIEKYDLKKFKNIIIFTAGIMSYSLFFYIATLIFLIYIIVISKANIRYRLFSIAILLIFIFISNRIESFSVFIWERLGWNSDKLSIVGDNRAHDDLYTFFNNIKGTNVYYFGLGLFDRELLTSFDSSAGYRNAILRYGLIGVFLYVTFFISYAYHYIGKRRELLLFIVLFISTLFQRPGFLNPHFIFLFVSFIMFNSNRNNSQISKGNSRSFVTPN